MVAILTEEPCFVQEPPLLAVFDEALELLEEVEVFAELAVPLHPSPHIQ